MVPKNLIPTLFLFAVISCNERKLDTINKPTQTNTEDSLTIPKRVDTPLATWASHSIHSFQLLELKDSFNATVYYVIDGYTNPNRIQSPYYFKAKAKVALWNSNQMSIMTDKFKFYYDIWNDTLILRDEAGIQEKLIRVYNDTVMRNQPFQSE